jgi:hypothetical protein
MDRRVETRRAEAEITSPSVTGECCVGVRERAAARVFSQDGQVGAGYSGGRNNER